MATLVTVVDKWFRVGKEGVPPGFQLNSERSAEKGAAQSGAQSGTRSSATRVRAFANDDIYFYVKRIDNTSVVRVADPEAGHICWKVIGSVVATALLVICLLMPNAYGVLAGYRIQELKREAARLQAEQSALVLEEAMLVSPARMEVLADNQSFVDPEPQSVIYLDGDAEGELASARPEIAGGAGR